VTADLEFAQHLADLADEVTRPYLQAEVAHRMKPDGSPVTDVDEAVEQRLLETVRRLRATDGWLSEELGAAHEGPRRWIVDGIDGTVAFVQGRPEWATLIALQDDSGVLVGVATAPALGRRWWAARGGGAWSAEIVGSGLGSATRLRVSATPSLDGARVGSWPPARLAATPQRPFVDRWATSGLGYPAEDSGVGWGRRPSWGQGSPGAGLLVAMARLDAAILFGGEPWDHAVPSLVVTEAGGSATAFDGTDRIDAGHCLFSNGGIHDALLVVLGGQPS
jgi:histidinol-phosphatase